MQQRPCAQPRRRPLFGVAGAVLAALLAAGAARPARAEPPSLDFAGYNKTFAIASRTYAAAPEDYALGLNRTRLKLTLTQPGPPGTSLQLHAENDTELRWGDYLGTAQARAERDAAPRQYWDLRSTWSDGARRRLSNDFFRAYAKLAYRETDAVLGRQRIPVGSGRLWSALDMLNPVNPLQVERDELVGVDALLIEQRLGALSKASAIYAPRPGGGSPRWVLRYRDHVGEADVSATLARYWGDDYAGLDVATQLGGLGVRGELTLTRPARGRRYASAVLGLDYAFENTLTLTLEGYLSSQDATERQRQIGADPLRAQVQPPGTRYIGLLGSYEFTPLLKATVVLLSNRGDHSRFASAALAWSVRDDLVLEAGLQRFSGTRNSEYGRGQPVTWVLAQWYF